MIRNHLRDRPHFTRSTWLLLLNLCLALSSVGLWWIALQQGLDWRGDFSAYYTGWTIVLRGDGARLYDVATQTRYQQALLNGQSFSEGLLPYINPPYITLPFVPLALFSRASAYLVWACVQLGLLIWLMRLLCRVAKSWSTRERLLMLSAVAGFPPLMQTLLGGTFSLLLSVCILQCYLALHQNRDARAGAWFVVGTLKFQLVALIGITLLAGRRWRAVCSAALFGGVLATLATWVFGWQIWPAYMQIIRQVNTFFGTNGTVPSAMYNLRGTLTLLLGNQQGPLINQLSMLLLLVCGLGIAWLWRGPWRTDIPDFELRTAFTLLLSVLCNPHVHPHDSFVLVVPAVLFYAYLRRQHLPTRSFGTFALLCPLVFLVGEFGVGARLGIRLPVIAMLIFAVWLLVALRQNRAALLSAPSAASQPTAATRTQK